MNFLITSGIIGVIFGVLLLIVPNFVKNINLKVSRTMSNVDDFICKNNQGIGICLTMSGLTLLFVAYYLYKT